MLSDVKRQYPRADLAETRKGISTAYMNRNPNLLFKVLLDIAVKGFYQSVVRRNWKFTSKHHFTLKMMPVLNGENTQYSSLFRMWVW